jgi:hypothetical protein
MIIEEAKFSGHSALAARYRKIRSLQSFFQAEFLGKFSRSAFQDECVSSFSPTIVLQYTTKSLNGSIAGVEGLQSKACCVFLSISLFFNFSNLLPLVVSASFQFLF